MARWPYYVYIIFCTYNFDTVLYQFFETRASDRINLGRNQLLKFLFYINSPFKTKHLFVI